MIDVKDQIYPNPNNGNFVLTVNTGIAAKSTAIVKVIDMYGKVVAQFTAQNNRGAIVSNYTGTALANGVYTVQYTVGTISKTMKMVVQK
jgi:uncharacterized lipoprotein YajG